MIYMRICFICPEYPPGPHGGIGSFTQLTARELVRLGHEVRVIGVYNKSYEALNYEVDQGVKVWRLHALKGKFGWIRVWIKQYLIIKKWINNKEIDLIEAPDSRGWYAFWGNLDVPLVLRSHGSNTYFAYLANAKINKFTKLLEKLSYNKANYYISVSKYTASITNKIFNNKKNFKIIYNGIELMPHFVRDQNETVNNKIIFSGTLVEKKGIIYLIEAMNLIYDKGIECSLEVYGKDAPFKDYPSMKEYLITNKINPKIKDKILFKGHVSRNQLLDEYQRSTVAVFPSLSEAFAYAPLEAMACGCPTVYSINGSGKELIEHGIDGLLIEPQKPESIANAILMILSNKDFAQKLSINALRKINNYSIEHTVLQTCNYYLFCIEDYKSKKNGYR
jgi:glycogen synthase